MQQQCLFSIQSRQNLRFKNRKGRCHRSLQDSEWIALFHAKRENGDSRRNKCIEFGYVAIHNEQVWQQRDIDFIEKRLDHLW